MKSWPILSLRIEREGDIVETRQRARRIAALLDFEAQDQTRIATAVSEIARNAHAYAGGGKVEFAAVGRRAPEAFEIAISDRGPGFADPQDPGGSPFVSANGLGLGIAGARRLMDALTIAPRDGGGSLVIMKKALPAKARALGPGRFAEIAVALTREAAGDPMAELRAQNQELMRSLEALEQRQLEAHHLSLELERTNKGVVALYAELDRKASELQELNETLERRIADGMAERERVEESLRQSQKMEAVGQLTGGVAHDFNNLLMIIGGSLEMLRRRVPQDPAILRLIDSATKGVARGSTLNQQLLAFARRQDLREEVVGADAFAPSCRHLIERAVSEDIEIRTDTNAGGWWCRTDPHQLETAILNLAINARDAMPRGGVLTLFTRRAVLDPAQASPYEAQAGEYVVLGVRDTGEGMTPEVLSRVFEPFFTTKEVGRGTGLGLSQVYGYARQSGGFVTIASAPGAGTSVEIHLPRTSPPPAVAAVDEEAPARITGAARILVVEDDAAVRSTTTAMLQDLGYTVIEAESAAEALTLVSRTPVDLVFTDVILAGGMNGLELDGRLAARQPHIPVLLTSGYTAQRLSLAGKAQARVLHKPYDEARLSQAVRAAIQDAGGAGA